MYPATECSLPSCAAPISRHICGAFAGISRNVILLKHMSAWLIGRSTARINNSTKNDVPRFSGSFHHRAHPLDSPSSLRSPLTYLWELGKKSHMGAACTTKWGIMLVAWLRRWPSIWPLSPRPNSSTRTKVLFSGTRVLSRDIRTCCDRARSSYNKSNLQDRDACIRQAIK